MDENNRLAELKAKKVLTDSEMKELANLSSPDSFKTFPDIRHIGIKDLNGFITNMAVGSNKSNDAFNQGFYIETISLRLQHIELYLRMFYVTKNSNGKIIDSEIDKRTFGNYINDCKNLGFDESLIVELKNFNEARINAIHKFALGEIKYEYLKEVCISTKGLDVKIRQYVFKFMDSVN